MVIYKYPVQPGEFRAVMPDGSHVVSVQVQAGKPQMWAMVDPNRKPVARRFRAVGTGESFESGWSYVGTFQLDEGSLVFHLLEDRV